MKKFTSLILILISLIVMVSCSNSEIRNIKGVWSNDKIGVIEFKQNKTFIFTLPFEVKTGKYAIDKTQLTIKSNSKEDSDYTYYYKIEGNQLTLSMREDMKALFPSENLVFNKLN